MATYIPEPDRQKLIEIYAEYAADESDTFELVFPILGFRCSFWELFFLNGHDLIPHSRINQRIDHVHRQADQCNQESKCGNNALHSGIVTRRDPLHQVASHAWPRKYCFGQNGADRHDPGIEPRRGLHRPADVDPARDDEERGEQHHERDVLVNLVDQLLPALAAGLFAGWSKR